MGVIEGVEAVFSKHLGALQEQIDNAQNLKAQKVDAQGDAQKAIDAAKDKEVASEQALKEAKEALKEANANHKELNRKCDGKSEMEAIAEKGASDDGLAKANCALCAFTELFER